MCPGVPGAQADNLAAAALRAFREATGWEAPPLRLSIAKRIPVAAGLGGGSADAAAALRLAGTPRGWATRRCCASWRRGWAPTSPRRSRPGAGWPRAPVSAWTSCPIPNPSFGLLVLPSARRALDRRGVCRGRPAGTGACAAGARRSGATRCARRSSLARRCQPAGAAAQRSAAAAISLCPEIADALAQAREAGADVALVSGSGPTVVGLFPRANGLGRAERAAAGLQGRVPAPICATPVNAACGSVLAVCDGPA